MINPGDAIDAIVDALQHIPDLVTAVGGAQNIAGYHPTFPGAMYFQQDLNELSPGQILVRYLGTTPGSLRENRIWKHKFGIYQVPPDTTLAPTSAGHYTFLIDLINGVPEVPGNTEDQKMLNYPMIPNCDSMDVPTIAIYIDTTLKKDYYFAAFTFPEIGDN